MAQKGKIYPTRDSKLKVSKAWQYEWMMLNGCLVKIKDYENKDTVIYNALIEAFCVHLRNFIEFFHRRDKRPFWADYLSGKTIPLKHKLDKYGGKINDLLSHLTYKRLNYNELKKRWPVLKIVEEVNENMFQFIDAADKNLLCDEIKMYKKQLEYSNTIRHSRFTGTTNGAIGQSKLVSKDH